MKLSSVVLAAIVLCAVVVAVSAKHTKKHHKKHHGHAKKHHNKGWDMSKLVESVVDQEPELAKMDVTDDSAAAEAADSDPCSHAKTKDGLWIRREWRDMRHDDQLIFLEAVNKMKTSGEYDKYPISHKGLDRVIHGVSIFYPWHRKFLTNYESALRNQGPKFKCLTLPFWDWTQDVDDAANSKIWDTECGFGTLKAGCVDDGPFAGWQVAAPINGETCLQRNPGGADCGGWPEGLPSAAVLKQWVLSNSFENFWGNTEGYPHGGPHCFVGGNMAQMSSPDDPIFFLHHAFIDKVWSDWQKCHDYDKPAHLMSSHWRKAFPYHRARTTRMPMHPSLDSSNVEAVWNTPQLNFVYHDDEYEQRTAFLHMCDQMYGRNGDDKKSASPGKVQESVLLDIGLNSTKGKFDPKAAWKRVAWAVKSSAIFMGKFEETGDVQAAIKDAALYECENTATDNKSDGVNKEWASKNGLTKLCDAGYCANPCKQLSGDVIAAPGSPMLDDMNKHPEPRDLDADEKIDVAKIEDELFHLSGKEEAGDKKEEKEEEKPSQESE